MRKLLGPARVGLALVAGATLLGTPAADAQTGGGLAGIQGRASASGIHALYAPEGLLPVNPLVDIGAPDALATIASGPSTFARASVLDPGDIIANPGAVLAQFSPDIPAGLFPVYPYRVSASSGVGEPSAESNPAPGLNARVEVSPTGSTARATMPAAVAPALATFGSVSSEASTTTDGNTVTITARTEVTGFDLLGVLTIEAVVSEATATSDGTDTTVEGGTTILGASLLGTPITIDATGIHQGEPSGPQTGGLLGPNGLLGRLLGGLGLGDVLGGLGIEVTVAGPVALDGATAGQMTVGGLHIDIELSERTLPVLAQLLGSLPPLEAPIPGAPGPEDVIAVLRATHLATIEVGRAVVSLEARAIPDFDLPPPPAGPVTPAPSSPAVLPATPGPSGLPSAPVAPSVGAPSAPTVVQPAAADVPGTGLAAGIGAFVLLGLLLQPFAGRGLAGLASTILAAGPADACPWEER